jgi:hypothetical protein
VTYEATGPNDYGKEFRPPDTTPPIHQVQGDAPRTPDPDLLQPEDTPDHTEHAEPAGQAEHLGRAAVGGDRPQLPDEQPAVETAADTTAAVEPGLPTEPGDARDGGEPPDTRPPHESTAEAPDPNGPPTPNTIQKWDEALDELKTHALKEQIVTTRHTYPGTPPHDRDILEVKCQSAISTSGMPAQEPAGFTVKFSWFDGPAVYRSHSRDVGDEATRANLQAKVEATAAQLPEAEAKWLRGTHDALLTTAPSQHDRQAGGLIASSPYPVTANTTYRFIDHRGADGSIINGTLQERKDISNPDAQSARGVEGLTIRQPDGTTYMYQGPLATSPKTSEIYAYHPDPAVGPPAPPEVVNKMYDMNRKLQETRATESSVIELTTAVQQAIRQDA